MATWANNVPNGNAKTRRRRWKIEDRESLNNLKYHIANEGCSDVQFDLAKQLLAKESDADTQTSSQEAVHWLLSAAQQGHEGALTLLKQCFETGAGITAENELEVIRCMSMTQGERAARKAARELFACLSNGSEHITPKQLERKMRKIYNLQKKRRRHGEPLTSSSSSEDEIEASADQDATKELKRRNRLGVGDASTLDNCFLNELQQRQQNSALITEENLVTAAINYTAGHLPAVNDALTLSVPHPDSLDHVPYFHRFFLHPIIFFTLLYHRFINFVSSLPTAIPTSIRFLFLISIYWLASNKDFTQYLPLGCYYTCIIVMIWSTCRMLKTKHDFIDFRIWSGLFLSYGDHNVQAEMSENRFLKNNMRPYLYFFSAFVICMLVYPQINSEWLPHSELTVLSCIFVFVTLFTFKFPDGMVLLSFGVNVLAKYPYEMDEVVATGWRFLDLKVPTFSSFVIGNGIEFCLNCRTALYLLIPVFLIILAKRAQWRGVYKYFIPHCVTLCWLQLLISASQSITFFGVVRCTLGLAGICLFLPVFGIVSLLLPIFVLIDWLGFNDANIRYGSAVLATIIALISSCFLALNRQTQKYITAVQIFVCIIAACILTFPYMTSNFNDPNRFITLMSHEHQQETNGEHQRIIISNQNEKTEKAAGKSSEILTWERFYAMCGPHNWERHNNKIDAQLRCSHFAGVQIDWEGTVVQVQLSRVSNIYEQFISKYFSEWLANVVRCMYGVRISEEFSCNDETYLFCMEISKILEKNQLFANKCSLHNWNIYEYEISVQMGVSILNKGASFILHATDHFSNFTHQLIGGDQIKFRGILQSSRLTADGEREDFLLSSTKPLVEVNGLECIFCQQGEIPAVTIEINTKSTFNERMRELTRGIKYLLNNLFNPLITFK